MPNENNCPMGANFDCYACWERLHKNSNGAGFLLPCSPGYHDAGSGGITAAEKANDIGSTESNDDGPYPP